MVSILNKPLLFLLVEAYNITGAYYGQGVGHIWLDNVRCNPSRDMSLLECPHRPTPVNACDHTRDASVRCRDDQGEVKTISATIINLVNTIMISWELGNSTQAGVPIMFKIECFSEKHSIVISVSNQTSTVSLGGLLPSISYNCCVSVVYELYTARRICTEIETTSTKIITVTVSESTTTMEEIASESSNSTNVIGGVLGFIMAVLLVLLILSGILLIYQLSPSWKERLSRILARYVQSLNMQIEHIFMSLCIDWAHRHDIENMHNINKFRMRPLIIATNVTR